jgi:cell division protein FtsL
MKDINFFERIKKNTPQKQASRAIKICVTILIITILLLGGAYTYLFIQKTNLNADIDTMNEQINQINTQNEGMDQIAAKKAKLQAFQSYANVATEFESNVDEYPEFNTKLMSSIENAMPSDVSITTFAYKDGVLNMTCQASKELSPSNFAKALKKLDLFEKVSYTGNFIADNSAGTLQFSIECTLKGGQEE